MAFLTRELIDAIAESVERGASPRRAAMACGVSDEVLYQWLDLARGTPRQQASSELANLALELLRRVQEAQSKRYVVLTDSLYHNATTQNAKTGWYDTQAADKLLSKSPETRREWHEWRDEQPDARVLPAAYAEARSLSVAELEQRLMDAGVDDPALPARQEGERAGAREDSGHPGGLDR